MKLPWIQWSYSTFLPVYMRMGLSLDYHHFGFQILDSSMIPVHYSSRILNWVSITLISPLKLIYTPRALQKALWMKETQRELRPGSLTIQKPDAQLVLIITGALKSIGYIDLHQLRTWLTLVGFLIQHCDSVRKTECF